MKPGRPSGDWAGWIIEWKTATVTPLYIQAEDGYSAVWTNDIDSALGFKKKNDAVALLHRLHGVVADECEVRFIPWRRAP